MWLTSKIDGVQNLSTHVMNFSSLLLLLLLCMNPKHRRLFFSFLNQSASYMAPHRATGAHLSGPYLQETVTSILVAGTLVLSGSNSPIDAIISHHAASAKKPETKREKVMVRDHRRRGRDGSKSICWDSFLWRGRGRSSGERGAGGRDTWEGRERERDTGGGGAVKVVPQIFFFSYILKFIHPSCVHGALHPCVRPMPRSERKRKEESAANRSSR